MGARKLETHLTVRLLALTGIAIIAVAFTSVFAIDRLLDVSDSNVARAAARGALDALDSELQEGDSFELAAKEVREVAARGGTSLEISTTNSAPAAGLASTASGACADVSDSHDNVLRACAETRGGYRVTAAIPINAHRAAVRSISHAMIAVAAIALFLVWFAIRRALRRPLAELNAIVAWTTRTLELEKSTDPPPAETTEIIQLETAFDVLVRRLLEALARERTNSAHIAHELRTPLTEIIGQLEALRSHDDASRLAISEIKTELLRFADVIEAILVLSEPTSKTPSSTIINVADIVRDVAPTTANVDAPDEALALGDERLIRLAVQNLVQNAQRYADGARDLRVSNDDDRVRVTVSDRGPGLDLSARERMFERYWRGAADIEGRGIGLALVRAVAERHDGSARADQRDDGPGLAVSFTVGKIIEWRTSQES